MFTGRGGCKVGDGEVIKRVFTMWDAPNTAESHCMLPNVRSICACL